MYLNYENLSNMYVKNKQNYYSKEKEGQGYIPPFFVNVSQVQRPDSSITTELRILNHSL
jgi:hypothetical protein